MEEHLTDVTTVFLGGGVLTTNNTFRYRTTHSLVTSEQLGYLSPGELSFVLAMMVRARDVAGEEAAMDGALERTQRRLFNLGLKALAKTPELRARLGIPTGIAPPSLPRLPPPARLPAVAIQTPEEDPTHIAWRVVYRNYGVAIVIGAALGLVASVVIEAIWPMLLAGLALPVGNRWRLQRCSIASCQCPVKAGDRKCVACGALLVGTEDRGQRTVEPEHKLRVETLEAAKRMTALEILANSQPPGQA